jgi:hypothetical protein
MEVEVVTVGKAQQLQHAQGVQTFHAAGIHRGDRVGQIAQGVADLRDIAQRPATCQSQARAVIRIDGGSGWMVVWSVAHAGSGMAPSKLTQLA